MLYIGQLPILSYKFQFSTMVAITMPIAVTIPVARVSVISVSLKRGVCYAIFLVQNKLCNFLGPKHVMQFSWSETNLSCSSSIVVSLEAISNSVSIGIGIVAIGSIVGISLGSRTIFKSQHKILPQHSFCHGGAHHVHVHSVHVHIHVHFQHSRHQPGLSIVIKISAQNFTSALLLPWW